MHTRQSPEGVRAGLDVHAQFKSSSSRLSRSHDSESRWPSVIPYFSAINWWQVMCLCSLAPPHGREAGHVKPPSINDPQTSEYVHELKFILFTWLQEVFKMLISGIDLMRRRAPESGCVRVLEVVPSIDI